MSNSNSSGQNKPPPPPPPPLRQVRDGATKIIKK